MGVSGCGDGVPGRLGEGMNGDLNAECTEFAEGTEGRMGKDAPVMVAKIYLIVKSNL